MSPKALENEVVVPLYTIQQYNENEASFKKLKISDLRKILKHYKKELYDNINKIPTRSVKMARKKTCNVIHDFALVGNKQVLVERVLQFFKQYNNVIKIQKQVRRLFVQQWIQLRGPALTDRKMCVNETDFCTLQPLNEINPLEFFSYKSLKTGFVYGFDYDSVLSELNRKRYLQNPYTRESMHGLIGSIRKIDRLSTIILKKKKENHEQRIYITEDHIQAQNIRRRTNSMVLPDNYVPEEITAKLREMRSMSSEQRITNLFMEIDQLGNYSHVSWFANLNFGEYIRLFRIMQDVWNYRSQLSFQVKLKICPLWDPFVSLHLNPRQTTYSEVKGMCLSVMEDLVYMGIDRDARMLGAFQVLTCLTFISYDARRSMPWLYEALI